MQWSSQTYTQATAQLVKRELLKAHQDKCPIHVKNAKGLFYLFVNHGEQRGPQFLRSHSGDQFERWLQAQVWSQRENCVPHRQDKSELDRCGLQQLADERMCPHEEKSETVNIFQFS